jgi:rhodanese-related sulfurtransferase
MAVVRRVSVVEAKKLLDEGYAYLDVRTTEEFGARHPSGAINVPLSLPGPAGGIANPEFLDVILRVLPTDAKIVVGCSTGVRSLRAAELLLAAGYTDVVDMRAGLDGARSAFGSKTEKGWADEGLPVSSGADAGSYASINPHRNF